MRAQETRTRTSERQASRTKERRPCVAILLAAGEGKRMRSALPKVLAPIAGLPMIGHVVKAARAAGADHIAVVRGPEGEGVAAAARAAFPGVELFEQTERRGTAHAVLQARKAFEKGIEDVLVVFGDTPLIEPSTLREMRVKLAGGAACVVLGFEARDARGYGRLVRRDGELVAIREEKDASREEREITLCNGGLMGFSASAALSILERISDDNSQGEFYLTDAVEIARELGLKTDVVIASESEVMGVNDRIQLAVAENLMQEVLRRIAMRGGATLIAPETVFLSHDTKLGRDVVVEPHVVFGEGVRVEEGARIRAFSHVEGAQVASGAIIGPFARLRPGADIGEEAHIGNFVEVKNARIGPGAKANHLAYLGDASIGAKSNIGAGAITCNYDGFEKHRTEIGSEAFIGTNTSLVAPVRIGQGAYVGSGSVITQDVPQDALALGRARQEVKLGWAAAFRERKAKTGSKGDRAARGPKKSRRG
ncbi:MAG: bifunctional UDP-N-acetylglucosamine diphosphorylase/glucosamine-1-phosphate N-acetyltransferase GlmU [Hyphomicrobiales bacterium]|nr:bifunctional UDP-N-acetylglucosamine diphosphorylase/glucosamine-1-phosphate N-acetyltransferase GlmU [Hyphomicrobiales bacterium]MBV9112154.1 bifunctional UDP-N-acetylglucosamine diphosphorylase/glucosamine-1-phosphate N-acetyltransferase GlmU [Hyphomicrobiales bacterium]